VGLDVGCGNGKYLSVNKNVFIVASDRYAVTIQLHLASWLTSQGQKHWSTLRANNNPTAP
jgi:hypothetical protein